MLYREFRWGVKMGNFPFFAAFTSDSSCVAIRIRLSTIRHLEFFIAWLRKNLPPEFADWVWDSRRALAIKGDGEDFRRGARAARAGEEPEAGLNQGSDAMATSSLFRNKADAASCRVAPPAEGRFQIVEPLLGDRKGPYSLRIKEQYRICFIWTELGPAHTEIVDYH